MPLKEKRVHPKWGATVEHSRLKVFNSAAFERYVAMFEGVDLELTIKKRVYDKSRQEGKFYHGVVVRMIAEAMGITDQQAHEFLKSLFLRTEEKSANGVRYKRVLSTTELSDTAYREYWGKCIRWAALPTLAGGLSDDSGLEVFIPMPNEVDYTNW